MSSNPYCTFVLDTPFFKVDDSNRPAFEARGMAGSAHTDPLAR